MKQYDVEHIRNLSEGYLSGAPKQIKAAKYQNSWIGVSSNVDAGSQSAIELGMLMTRHDNDFNGARKVFERGVALVQDFEKMNLSESEYSEMYYSSFSYPLYCCLLAKEFTVAQALANIVMTHSLRDEATTWDERAKVLAALILDDKVAFKSHLKIHHEFTGKDKFWNALLVYFDLCEAVIERDNARFDVLLIQIIDDFPKRGKGQGGRSVNSLCRTVIQKVCISSLIF